MYPATLIQKRSKRKLIENVLFIEAPFGAVAMAIAYSATMYILTIPGLWYAGRPIQLSIASVGWSIWAYFASGSWFLWVGFSSLHIGLLLGLC